MKVIIYDGGCGTLKKAYYDEESDLIFTEKKIDEESDLIFTEWMTREKFEKITKVKVKSNEKVQGLQVSGNS